VGFTRNQRLHTAEVLVISILLYPLLSYLTTPLVSSHEDGVWSVVCTLQGTQQVFIDLDGDPAGPESCPALKLLQAAGTATPAMPPAMPGQFLYAASVAERQRQYPYHTPHLSVFSSRAPPLG